jgi:hypothetical protein
MYLIFEDALGVERLAALVEQYRIDGLEADLTLGGDGLRIVIAELSVHGDLLAEQIRRTRCQLARASSTPAVEAGGLDPGVNDRGAQWRTRMARVTVRAGSAVPLVDDPQLRYARLIADFSPDELARLMDYHRHIAGGATPCAF